MPTDTEICNLAIGHLGVGKEIQSLASDSSQEARICRRFFAQSRDETLRDFPWPFTRKFARLGKVADDPTTEWGLSYRYPSDCIRFGRILSGIRNDSRQTRVPMIISHDATGKLIFTDAIDAVAEYHAPIIETGKWDAAFVGALALLLAYYIAPGLTSGDPNKLGDRAQKGYFFFYNKAQEDALHEQQEEEVPEAESITGRG